MSETNLTPYYPVTHTDAQEMADIIEGAGRKSVKVVRQNLTSSEKSIARSNIDVPSVNDLNTVRESLALNIGTGDVAAVPVPKDSYVFWRNSFFVATVNIAEGETLSGKLAVCSTGILNELAGSIDSMQSDVDSLSNNYEALSSDVSDISGDITSINNDITSLGAKLNTVQNGMAVIVDGDTCSVAVPAGGYAYVKNNTHGLADGLYKNTSSGAFPVSGGTASSSIFTSVSGGLGSELTSLNSKFANLIKTKTDYNLTSDANGVIISSVSKDYALVSYYYSNYILLPFRPLATSQYWHFIVCDAASTGVLPQTNVTRDLYVKYIEQ